MKEELSNNTLLGDGYQPSDIKCPNCGQFSGPRSRCQHCGSSLNKRMSIRLLRYAAICLATLGLAGLYLMSTHSQTPTVPIDSIEPTMNFGRVCVEGKILAEPYIKKVKGKIQYAVIKVADKTGQLSLFVKRNQVKSLIESDKLPRSGDIIKVVGSLNLTANEEAKMYLRSAEHLELKRIPPREITSGMISRDMLGRDLSLQGTIQKIRIPEPKSNRPWKIDLRDSDGTLTVVFWPKDHLQKRFRKRLKKGGLLRVRASLTSYAGKLQLKVEQASDMEFLGTPQTEDLPKTEPKSGVKIGDITADHEGEWLTIKGVVESIQVPEAGSKAPHKAVLRQGDDRITVVYWDSVAKKIGEQGLETGRECCLSGVIDIFRGELQIKLARPSDLKFETKTQDRETQTNPAQILEIGELAATSSGEAFQVSGILGTPRSIRGGVIYPLRDETGSVSILLWSNQLSRTTIEQFGEGKKATVSGILKIWKGTMELVPAEGKSIKIEKAKE